MKIMTDQDNQKQCWKKVEDGTNTGRKFQVQSKPWPAVTPSDSLMAQNFAHKSVDGKFQQIKFDFPTKPT